MQKNILCAKMPENVQKRRERKEPYSQSRFGERERERERYREREKERESG